MPGRGMPVIRPSAAAAFRHRCPFATASGAYGQPEGLQWPCRSASFGLRNDIFLSFPKRPTMARTTPSACNTLIYSRYILGSKTAVFPHRQAADGGNALSGAPIVNLLHGFGVSNPMKFQHNTTGRQVSAIYYKIGGCCASIPAIELSNQHRTVALRIFTATETR